MSRRNASRLPKRRTALGLSLERSAKEILAHLKGEISLPTRCIELPDEVNVTSIRSDRNVASRFSACVLCKSPDAS